MIISVLLTLHCFSCKGISCYFSLTTLNYCPSKHSIMNKLTLNECDFWNKNGGAWTQACLPLVLSFYHLLRSHPVFQGLFSCLNKIWIQSHLHFFSPCVRQHMSLHLPDAYNPKNRYRVSVFCLTLIVSMDHVLLKATNEKMRHIHRHTPGHVLICTHAASVCLQRITDLLIKIFSFLYLYLPLNF